MRKRSLLTLVGTVAAAVGLAMVFQPGLATAIGGSDTQIIIVGLLALVQGLRVANDRRGNQITGAETDDPEIVAPMPTPGHAFDERLSRVRAAGFGRARDRREIRTRLTDLAVEAVARDENCSREVARERVESGEWTDDPYAAAFLSNASTADVPWYAHVRNAIHREPRFQRHARHAVDALARYAEVADP